MERFAAAPADRPGTAKAGPASARALLAGVVDYAGLFPPAALSMPDAVAEYVAARSGADAWMLGRFVLPAARLPEFAEACHRTEGSCAGARLSAIVRDQSEADRAAIATFNAAAAAHRTLVDSVESKPQALDGIDWLDEAYAADHEIYVEVPAGGESLPWLERVAARGLRAKVRTGGLTPDAFPAPAALIGFIASALRLTLPFKATAGLHHALRGSYRLTYDGGAPAAPMYGYLNVLLATAALRAGLSKAQAERLLLETDASSLVFTDTAIRWADTEFPVSALHDTRAHHLVSFGSCSFREPADEYRSLTSL